MNEIRKLNGDGLELISKPYYKMTEDERQAFVQWQCDRTNATPGNLDKSIYDCPDCLNKGYISLVREIKRGDQISDFSETMRDCRCKAIRASIRRLKRSGLENVVKKYTFDRYNAAEPWQQHIKDTAQRFVAEGGSVFFIGGQTGAGKTHICTAITIELLRQGEAAYYMLWQDETVRLKACVMDSEDYQEQMQRLKEIEVLYIDDFFKPVGDGKAPSPADIRLAYELINYRYNNAGLITIISSERLIGEILDIDEATGGRLVEYAGDYMINIGRNKARNYRLRNTGLI